MQISEEYYNTDNHTRAALLTWMCLGGVHAIIWEGGAHAQATLTLSFPCH